MSFADNSKEPDTRSSDETVRVPVTTTWLEMLEPPASWPGTDRLQVAQARIPNPALNRFFYATVGADWLWHGRAGWTWAKWEAAISTPGYQTWVAYTEGSPAGYFELDATEAGEVEIVYFGLLSAFVGSGMGAEFIASCLEAAWAVPGTTRVWLHTCSWDHPRALQNYLRAGFSISQVEEAEEDLPARDLEPWPGSEREPKTTVWDHLAGGQPESSPRS